MIKILNHVNYVQAVKIAWKKLEEGCSIEAAKSFCEPWMLNEMMNWKVDHFCISSQCLLKMMSACYMGMWQPK